MKNPYKTECLIIKSSGSAYSAYAMDGIYMGSLTRKRFKGSRWYANYKDNYQMKGCRSLKAALAKLLDAYRKDSNIIVPVAFPLMARISQHQQFSSFHVPIEYIPKANDIVERTIKPEPPCALDAALSDLGMEDA